MTDGGGDKPGKPDPFAPLPLADLPPVRRRGESGPTASPPAEPPRTRAPSIPPTAFVQVEAAAPVDQAWDASGGQQVSGAEVSGTFETPAGLEGGQATSGGPVWETPAGHSWSSTDSADSAPQAWTEAPVPAGEPPLLPEAYSEDALREAVGATPRVEPKQAKRRAQTPLPVDDDDDDDDRPGKKRSRKTMFVAAMSIVVGGGIAALVFLGKANSARYVIACEAERVVVEQGRSFPPWGTSSLDGAEWKPLKIPPETACHPRETEDLGELARWYGKMLTDFADKQLSAREITKVDEAEAALKQALLVTRSLRTDDDAKDARDEIDRLLGDVVYWRASARLRSASEALADAAKQFDAAATQRPQHFKDAAEWAKYARTVIDQLKAGPGGIPPTTFPPVAPAERPTAPPGTALPVEPEQGSAGSAEPPAPVTTVPSGGVLL